MEQWIDIPGYEGLYMISDHGNVLSLNYHNTNKPSLLKMGISKGYQRVTLCRDGKVKRFQVHVLVAMTFIKNPDNKPHVNHINGNKICNHVSNLEWCTPSENEKHSYNTLGKVNPQRKLSKEDVAYIKANAVKGDPRLGGKRRSGNIRDIASQFGIATNTVHNIINNVYYVQA